MSSPLSRKKSNVTRVPAEGESVYGTPKRPARPDYAIDPETGCWNWLKSVDGRGYPIGPRKYGIYKAHRIYFYLATGINPGSNHVHHVCRNTSCVNPEHLELLPQDKHFEEHGREKRVLTDEEGAEIRRLCADPDLGYAEIAERFGVSYMHVCDLAMGNRWAGDYKGLPPVRPLRECRGCGGLVPAERRRHARYCSDECKIASRWNRLTPEQKSARTVWQRQHRAKKREAASV